MMGTPDRSLHQIRAILDKLDRSIDAARARRLDIRPEQQHPPHAEPERPLGRARPLRPSGSTAFTAWRGG